MVDSRLVGSTDFGRGTARAEDAQGTPAQSDVSPSILVYEEKMWRPCHGPKVPLAEREFFIDNLLARIHCIIVMISVDRPCAMGV